MIIEAIDDKVYVTTWCKHAPSHPNKQIEEKTTTCLDVERNQDYLNGTLCTLSYLRQVMLQHSTKHTKNNIYHDMSKSSNRLNMLPFVPL